MRSFTYFRGFIALLGIFRAFYPCFVSAQEPKGLPEPLGFEAQFGFGPYLDSRFAESFRGNPDAKELNYDGAVGLAAIPTRTSPASNLEELSRGKVVGALFLSTGSLRLHLPPGSYLVFLFKDGTNWRVKFLDGTGRPAGEAPATVAEAPEVATPYVSLDHSVCHRFGKTIVCY